MKESIGQSRTRKRNGRSIGSSSSSTIKQKLYLGGDFYSAPAVYVKEGSGSWQLFHICRDYLGSITHVNNPSGSVRQELSYDAWGRLRNPTNQTVYTPGEEPTLFLGRGYTGHEHLSWFGLVNMNARLYDPALGRFLAPDPYVQMPDFSQSYNRYSYCLNNPLIYTDPDGEFWEYIVVGLFLYAMSARENAATYDDKGVKHYPKKPSDWQWNPFKWSSWMFTTGSNTDGSNPHVNVSAGNSNIPMPTIGYNKEQGWGLGYSYNGNTNMYYPGYNYNAPEQKAARAYEETRASGWDWTFYTGTGMTAMSETFFSQDLGTWMGKNGKIYDQKWGGNQYAGGKYKFANNFAKPFKWGSNALGIYSMYNSVTDALQGEISPEVATEDLIFGGAAIYSGFWGGWANLWYNLGKEYGTMTTYLRKQEERKKYKSVLFNY